MLGALIGDALLVRGPIACCRSLVVDYTLDIQYRTDLVRDDRVLVDVHLQLRYADIQICLVELIRDVPSKRPKLLAFNDQRVEET